MPGMHEKNTPGTGGSLPEQAAGFAGFIGGLCAKEHGLPLQKAQTS